MITIPDPGIEKIPWGWKRNNRSKTWKGAFILDFRHSTVAALILGETTLKPVQPRKVTATVDLDARITNTSL